MPRWEATWTPAGDVLADSYAVYLRQKGSGLWVSKGTTQGTAFSFDIAASSDVYELGVAPVVNGAEAEDDAWTVLEFRPTDTSDLDTPSNVTNFSGAQSGSSVILTWSAVTTDGLKEYEIRQGSAWATATKVHTAAATATRAEFLWHYSGSITYLIKAKTEAGLESATAASVTLNIEAENYMPAQATYDEHSGGYTGTKSNTEVSGGNLQITAAPATASAWTANANTYTWSPLLRHLGTGTYVTAAKDAGSVLYEKVEVSTTPSLDSPTVYAAEWRMLAKPEQDGSGNWVDIGTRGTLDKVTANGSSLVDGLDVKVEIDTTPDDPAGTPTWDGWRVWVPGAVYRYRGVRLRITLTSVWFFNLRLTGFTWRRRRQNRKDEKTVTLSGTGGTDVTWGTTFTSAPYVTATVVTGAGALFATVDTISTTGCKVYVWSDAGVEQSGGTVHVHALGV